MDQATADLTMQTLAGLGVLMVWLAPKLSDRALMFFFAMLAAIGFTLAIAGPHIDAYRDLVPALFAIPGIVLALMPKSWMIRAKTSGTSSERMQ